MAVTGLNHYNLRASMEMLDGLRDFYTSVVGLRVGERPPFRSKGYWLYAGDSAVLHLSETGAGETRSANQQSTFDHAAFTCENRLAVEAHLQQCGIAYSRAEVPGIGQIQLFFKDPAGNGVELNFADAQS